MTRAVVFAYHAVGVRCLKVLLAHGIDVPLVVTHEDSLGEAIWFDSVAATAALYGIPVRVPADPNTPELVTEIAARAPDFLFSFYYRRLLKAPLLALAPRGALNMHGSLLPKYRGRAPVNWAVLHGERQTGATLHYMTAQPDAGDLVAQTAIPILPDDTAREVFDKVTVAAEVALDGVLPALIAGTAPRTRQDPAAGSYFGGRRPEDGVIDWRRDAFAIHNLVRAVAPPYPGAFTTVGGTPARVLRTRVHDAAAAPTLTPTIGSRAGRIVAHCGGGGMLEVLSLEIDGEPCAPAALTARFGPAPALLGEAKG
jgi:methionyl-tRNA formyltransferase